MYKNPVTVAQFRKYDNANGNKYNWNEKKPSWGWLDNHPMVNVSWMEATAYATWAGVALPTEAQWEYAARGGLDGKNYPWGDDWDGSKCANSVEPNDLYGTKPVESYAANGYGLYDMAGNVWQWCADFYDSGYYKTAAARGRDPKGPASGTSRVLRGGSWYVGSEGVFRCAFRDYVVPDDWYNGSGFRCCAVAPE
jgi:formylglycine-generating enzyme required for sulfatase activity